MPLCRRGCQVAEADAFAAAPTAARAPMTARVLVVDDIAANLRLLEAKLLNEYYEVAVAASGSEALATCAAAGCPTSCCST